MTIYEKLSNIQQKLKAPKDLRNTFGGYNYRSAESILENVKPLLQENQVVLTLSDSIEDVNGMNYVKATATLMDYNGQSVSVSAFAREPLDKKGMDTAQITGASSSYARKYALNGLLCIDDTKDSDSIEVATITTKASEKEKKEIQEERERLLDRGNELGINWENASKFKGKSSVLAMTNKDLKEVIEMKEKAMAKEK